MYSVSKFKLNYYNKLNGEFSDINWMIHLGAEVGTNPMLDVRNKEVYPTNTGTPLSPPPSDNAASHWSISFTVPLWLAEGLVIDRLLFTLIREQERLWHRRALIHEVVKSRFWAFGEQLMLPDRSAWRYVNTVCCTNAVLSSRDAFLQSGLAQLMEKSKPNLIHRLFLMFAISC